MRTSKQMATGRKRPRNSGRRAQPGKPLRVQGAAGSTIVEFALVLPLLVLLLCGIMDMGNLYYQLNIVNEAAREGARIAATGGNLQGVTTAVRNYGDQLQVSMVPPAPSSGSNVTVTVTNSVEIYTPIISNFFPHNPYTVTGKSVMRVE